MKLIREMSLIKDRVKALLKLHPHLRDKDNRLIATIWKFDLFKMGLTADDITGKQFMSFYAEGKLTNAETIRRVRQKIQEENPELRGTAYSERQKQAEEVKKQI
jgi:hypothetical protein